jgi:hypothetical protein
LIIFDPPMGPLINDIFSTDFKQNFSVKFGSILNDL